MTEETKVLTAYLAYMGEGAKAAKPHIESTLTQGQWRIYTELWQLKGKELARLQRLFDIADITAEGGQITLTLTPKHPLYEY